MRRDTSSVRSNELMLFGHVNLRMVHHGHDGRCRFSSSLGTGGTGIAGIVARTGSQGSFVPQERIGMHHGTVVGGTFVAPVFGDEQAAGSKYLPLLVSKTYVEIALFAVSFVEHFSKGQIVQGFGKVRSGRIGIGSDAAAQEGFVVVLKSVGGFGFGPMMAVRMGRRRQRGGMFVLQILVDWRRGNGVRFVGECVEVKGELGLGGVFLEAGRSRSAA